MKTQATATASTKIKVELSTFQHIGFATVDLHGETHYDLYQMYKRLPDMIECNGKLYGKSCWDSDQHKAYYRTDIQYGTPQ